MNNSIEASLNNIADKLDFIQIKMNNIKDNRADKLYNIRCELQSIIDDGAKDE